MNLFIPIFTSKFNNRVLHTNINIASKAYSIKDISILLSLLNTIFLLIVKLILADIILANILDKVIDKNILNNANNE